MEPSLGTTPNGPGMPLFSGPLQFSMANIVALAATAWEDFVEVGNDIFKYPLAILRSSNVGSFRGRVRRIPSVLGNRIRTDGRIVFALPDCWSWGLLNCRRRQLCSWTPAERTYIGIRAIVYIGEDSFVVPVIDSGERAGCGRNRRAAANNVDVDADRVRLRTVVERAWRVGAASNREMKGKQLMSNNVSTRFEVAWDCNGPGIVVLDQTIASVGACFATVNC
jgi:hypothetical protein